MDGIPHLRVPGLLHLIYYGRNRNPIYTVIETNHEYFSFIKVADRMILDHYFGTYLRAMQVVHSSWDFQPQKLLAEVAKQARSDGTTTPTPNPTNTTNTTATSNNTNNNSEKK